jgi:hypothetical protein
VHTIQWTATDTGGNTDGIGSRYFSIQNSRERTALNVQRSTFNIEPLQDPGTDPGPVGIRKGFNQNNALQKIHPDGKGIINIKIKELERVEIHLDDIGTEFEKQIRNNSKFKIQNSKLHAGYLEVGGMLRRLPIGSTINIKTGTFSWQPGPGFLGEYKLVFPIRAKNGTLIRKRITITIVPRF